MGSELGFVLVDLYFCLRSFIFRLLKQVTKIKHRLCSLRSFPFTKRVSVCRRVTVIHLDLGPHRFNPGAQTQFGIGIV